MQSDFSNFQQEISMREQIMSDIRSGKKVSKEMRSWLATHRLYNRKLGYPHLNIDIIHLGPRGKYRIDVDIISTAHEQRIIPILSSPDGLGRITTKYELKDIDGRSVSTKSVKMLALELDTCNTTSSDLEYQSKSGLLGIFFECDYYDDKQNLHIRKSSATGDVNFAMIAESISNNKIMYRCMAPTSHSFENLVFTVEWTSKTGDGLREPF